MAGNDRVIAARLSDARFFWDQDRKTPLEALLPRLDSITFHAKLGSQGERVRRLEQWARLLASPCGADPSDAALAARLCKADLVTGMVGEFPELQGLMGRYYAQGERQPEPVANAIGEHYKPQGPSDAVPSAPVFHVGPTGSIRSRSPCPLYPPAAQSPAMVRPGTGLPATSSTVTATGSAALPSVLTWAEAEAASRSRDRERTVATLMIDSW